MLKAILAILFIGFLFVVCGEVISLENKLDHLCSEVAFVRLNRTNTYCKVSSFKGGKCSCVVENTDGKYKNYDKEFNFILWSTIQRSELPSINSELEFVK